LNITENGDWNPSWTKCKYNFFKHLKS
jgi:hypothetical protein